MVEAAVAVDFLPQDGSMNRLLPHLDQVYGALRFRAASADRFMNAGGQEAIWLAALLYSLLSARMRTWVMWLPTKFVVGPVCGRS